MKRWLVIISLLVFILTFSSLAFAANNVINISMNGSKVQVNEVPIMMNGQAFISDVPSFIYGDRTLVPVRFVAQSFGADVEWDQKTKTATVLHDNKVVKLTIDSNKVVVNSESKTLDNNSIPKLVSFSNNDSRTMVPVRFISEVLGYDVGWDSQKQIAYINSSGEDYEVIDLNPDVGTDPIPVEPQKPEKPTIPDTVATINAINVVKGSSGNHTIVIKTNQGISYDSLFLPDSDKLVIDIENSRLNITGTIDKPGDINVNDDDFSRVTYSQYDISPFVTRIVVELDGKIDYKFYSSEDGKTTTIAFEDNEFGGISVEKIDGKEALVIDNINNVKYNVIKLKNPSRVVIDLMDTNLADKVYSYNIQAGFIKGVRVSQFFGDNNYSSNDRIVRIVLDVLDGVDDPNVSIELDDDRLIIYPEKSFWEYITYDNTNLEKIITIKNEERTRYDVDYDSERKIMEITIPKENSELAESYALIQDKFIEDIRTTENDDDIVVAISFKRGIIYDVLSDSRSEEIILSLKKDPSILYTDKTIVLDPGHGGKDPGAISPNGTKEKDVNLILGLKTQALLESLGYEVIMTRTNDTFIDLYERANIANRNNADMFISIHHNATINNAINGLEILYCPRGQGTAKVEDQYPLAEALSESIIELIGGNNRGIFQKPALIVTREANMPAALVEVGYLSNSADEARILNDGFQNKVVEGIVLGIQNYFDMN